jgi:acyl-CoA synthetase (AMP-forming)/AMP-acid ligase II
MPAMPVHPTRALYDRLIASLATSPERPVARLLPRGEPLDVDSFERRVIGAERRLARLGRGAGPGPGPGAPGDGDLVLLSARNLDSYLVAVAALWKRGNVLLLADADLARAEIAALVAAFRPSACLLDRRVEPPAGRVEPLGEDLAGLHAWLPPPRGRRGGSAAHSSGTAADRPWAGAAVIRLTSGTTGAPRGVLVTAQQLLADSRQITTTMGIGPDDTMVAAIPLGHAYGFVHAVMALLSQGTRLVLVEHPLPAPLIEALSGPGPLVLPGTPYLLDLILQAAGRRRFRGLRLCLSAGAPLPERLSRRFHKRFGLPIRTFYGASECGGICYDRSERGILPDGCVGTPLEGVTLTVRPEPRLTDGTGRICVSSPAVASGYLPSKRGDGLGDGLFRSADLGRLDADGRIRLEGRIDRLINVGGRKVNPAEVEAVLRAVEGVRHAVVFGVPDRHRGQSVAACVVARRGLRREAVLAPCRDRLAPFKVPRHVEFVDSIPVTGRGKVDRGSLARLVSPAAAPPARA